MNRRTLTLILLVAGVVACEQKPKTEPAVQPAQPAQPATVTQTAPANPAAEQQQDALESVAVSEDFEESAAREITADNLDSQMDTLEKELDQ